ncbi:hypothetical protein [Nocardia transvalensis]|uniref:hypothetical protein n=1 Tax=Nocardia transvalensis TaxID=37333 RepID=UPI00189337D9|nr:hypothetical protein [Nocardia transvalensis]MBF6332321.1 hypothetical protein [Nocardia transvalensis]
MAEFVDHLPEARTLSRAAINRAFADELRGNPGRWAKYPHAVAHPSSAKYRISSGKASAFGPGFQVQVRDGALFIRYIGDTKDKP